MVIFNTHQFHNTGNTDRQRKAQHSAAWSVKVHSKGLANH